MTPVSFTSMAIVVFSVAVVVLGTIIMATWHRSRQSSRDHKDEYSAQLHF